MIIKPTLLMLAILGSWSICTAAVADRIVLKDGNIEQSDKIWESENYYHFILKGTKNVEIRYAKSIVDRIERVSSEQSHRSVSRDSVMAGPSAEEKPAVENRHTANAGADGDSPSAAPASLPEDKIIEENKGIAFYDPRRNNRYWVTRQSRHNTLKSARNAISALYGRSSQWVEAYMGEANDLGVIHHNLIAQLKKERSEAPAFDARESTLKSPRMEQHFGARRDSNKAKPRALREEPGTGKGILFYDPRRSEKYWSSQKTRHNTLQEAIRALANQYEVSEEWVSNHMGDTNDLAEIHRNIQTSIVTSSTPSD